MLECVTLHAIDGTLPLVKGKSPTPIINSQILLQVLANFPFKYPPAWAGIISSISHFTSFMVTVAKLPP